MWELQVLTSDGGYVSAITSIFCNLRGLEAAPKQSFIALSNPMNIHA